SGPEGWPARAARRAGARSIFVTARWSWSGESMGKSSRWAAWEQEAQARHRFSAARAGHGPGRAFGRTRWFPPVEQRQDARPLLFGRGTPPAVIAHAMKARGQH